MRELEWIKTELRKQSRNEAFKHGKAISNRPEELRATLLKGVRSAPLRKLESDEQNLREKNRNKHLDWLEVVKSIFSFLGGRLKKKVGSHKFFLSLWIP